MSREVERGIGNEFKNSSCYRNLSQMLPANMRTLVRVLETFLIIADKVKCHNKALAELK